MAQLPKPVEDDVPIGEGATLRVSFPSEWDIGPSKLGFSKYSVVRYKGEPGFELQLYETRNWPASISIPFDLPFECDVFLSVFRSAKEGNTAVLMPRPGYFSEDFYSRVLVHQSAEQNTEARACLFMGSSNLIVALRPVPNEMQGRKITAMLQAIAGMEEARAREASGSTHR